MASQVPAQKGSAFIIDFTLYKNDGSVITNPGSYTKKIIKDGGAVADVAASVVEVDTTYGCLSLTLSPTEMTADRVWVQIKDDTSGCVPYTTVIYTSSNLIDDLTSSTEILEGTLTYAEALRIILSALGGKCTVDIAGGTVTFRDTADTKNRIVATVDSNGTRSAVTLIGT
jgi:hypothetical protein